MNAVPRVNLEGELRTIPARNHLVIECEVASPPSRKGATVYVAFDVEQTTKLLLLARDAAIQDRARTMPR